MRKNKKLLLASVAAMGALALGVGATSTFAWYKASGTAVNVTKQSIVTASQAAITGTQSTVNVVVSAVDSDQAKMFLTTGVDVAATNDTIALSAGEGAYYNGTVDKAHMIKVTADENHRAAINVSIAVSPADGFKAADGNYHLHITLADPGRLSNAVSGTGYASYVSTGLVLDIPFTVSGMTFSTVTKYAVVSVNGAIGDQTSLTLTDTSWSFTVDQEAGENAAAAAKIITRS